MKKRIKSFDAKRAFTIPTNYMLKNSTIERKIASLIESYLRRTIGDNNDELMYSHDIASRQVANIKRYSNYDDISVNDNLYTVYHMDKSDRILGEYESDAYSNLDDIKSNLSRVSDDDYFIVVNMKENAKEIFNDVVNKRIKRGKFDDDYDARMRPNRIVEMSKVSAKSNLRQALVSYAFISGNVKKGTYADLKRGDIFTELYRATGERDELKMYYETFIRVEHVYGNGDGEIYARYPSGAYGFDIVYKDAEFKYIDNDIFTMRTLNNLVNDIVEGRIDFEEFNRRIISDGIGRVRIERLEKGLKDIIDDIQTPVMIEKKRFEKQKEGEEDLKSHIKDGFFTSEISRTDRMGNKINHTDRLNKRAQMSSSIPIYVEQKADKLMEEALSIIPRYEALVENMTDEEYANHKYEIDNAVSVVKDAIKRISNLTNVRNYMDSSDDNYINRYFADREIRKIEEILNDYKDILS